MKRSIEMFTYRQALVRMRQGDSDRNIARAGLMGRNKLTTVRELAQQHGWLDPERPLPDDSQLASVFGKVTRLPTTCISTVEPFRSEVTAWFQQGLQGTTILSALQRQYGYQGSYSAVARFLQQLAADEVPVAKSRLDFSPGEAAQVDFGTGPLITDVYSGEAFKTWVFVMTLCWSRHQYAELVRDQSSATWLSCHRHAFEWFGGVVSKVTIDNAKCAITRACTYDPEVQRAYGECAEGYGFKIDACPPRDPQKKGIVEAGVKYVKRAFFPLRTFRTLADANQQLQDWVRSEAGNRIHGTTREAPLTRFVQTERALLKPLPDVPPVLAIWAKVKVHRDAHVQHDYCLYSVPFHLVGQTLWLKATPTLVSVFHEYTLMAAHPLAMRRGHRSTLPDHMPPDAQAWQLQDTQWCLREAARIGPQCHALVEHLFADRVLEKLRTVQGVLRLEKTYSATRLEAACARALHFDSPFYRTVKTILSKGLDQTPAGETGTATTTAAHDATDNASPGSAEPATAYSQGGRFYRDTQTLLPIPTSASLH